MGQRRSCRRYERSEKYFQRVRQQPLNVNMDVWKFWSQIYTNGSLVREMHPAHDDIVTTMLEDLSEIDDPPAEDASDDGNSWQIISRFGSTEIVNLEDDDDDYPFKEIEPGAPSVDSVDLDTFKTVVPPPLFNAVRGLKNYGNTCYMNSALQCLLCIPELTEFFKIGGHRRELNTTGRKFQGQLAMAYNALLVDLLRNPLAIFPDDLRILIRKYARNFDNDDQQDAQEFLNFFLDELHEDLNRVEDKPNVAPIEPNGQPDAEKAQQYWENHLKRDDSVIVDLFYHQLKYKRTCRTCQTERVLFECAASLTLELPEVTDGSRSSIYDCIAKHTEEEVLSGENAWVCPTCKTQREASLKVDMWKMPRVLILLLKRFSFTENSHSKINTSVEFPVRGLELPDNSENRTCVYDLVAACNHVGGDVHQGHYTALCHREDSWYYISDDHVTELNGLPDEVSSTQAYVLIYHRRDVEEVSEEGHMSS
uniref:ubiquitinyl hydrolase 1 n=1 Tax=Steinernema glaseri TaxID=37863 RepID=A0A1I7YLJ0_9BILA